MDLTTRPSLGDLLRRRDLALRARTRISPVQRDTELRGAHSSDLADPTPFLDERVVLLTTGAQFADFDAGAYVDRIRASGVAALGFGSGVIRPDVPADLVAACERAGLPLFEVPYRTPFLAVARAVADAIAHHEFGRRTWALSAQRAIALAALREAPLPSAIGELANRLGTWVGLFDPVGELSVSRPEAHVGSAAHLRTTAHRILERGVPAADSVTADGRTFTMQTLGRAGRLRGILAVEGTGLDQEARAVVTTVIAMAGFALERAAELDRAQGALRSGVLRALVRGDVEFARDVAGAAWTRLPEEPVLALAVRGDDDLVEYLGARAAHTPEDLFFAPTDTDIVVLVSEGADPPAAAWTRFHAAVGMSRPTNYAGIALAVDEARAAIPDTGIATFTPGRNDMLRASNEDQVAAARAFLSPLREHPALEVALRAWLAHDANGDRAAAALGIHRHTLRARIASAAEALDTDLSGFDARAELWAALRIADAAAALPPERA